jgi:hypothetical protein
MSIFYACNRVELSFKYNLISTVGLLIGLAVAIPRGLEAATIVGLLVSVYSVVPFMAGLQLAGLSRRHAWGVLGPPTIASAVMWVAIALARPLLKQTADAPIALLIIHIAIGLAVYCITLQLLSRRYFLDFREVLSRLLAKS